MSPYSRVVFVAVWVDEARKMADGEDYNAINPLGYAPALVLDDRSVLFESAAIAQYIADRDSTDSLHRTEPSSGRDFELG
jgi:glutathione S-transferase